MRLNNSLVLLFGIIPIIQGSTQGTKETIKQFKSEIKADSVAKKVDSLISINDSLNVQNDSLAGINSAIVGTFEKSANNLEYQASALKKDVQKLVNKPPDTVAVVRTKYVPTLGPVNKEAYWQRQREYTDSIAQHERDSIRWNKRGILRKLFGTGKKYMK